MPSILGHPFRVLLTTGKALALAHVFWSYGYSIEGGQGPSMLPTFEVMNEWFVISKRHRHGRDIGVGDVVCFSIPINDTEGIKRVMGLPGDYVLLHTPGSGNESMIQVPQGHCYVVGDNLPWSRDCRDYGPIPMALVKGKVIAKCRMEGMWPFHWFTKLESGLQRADKQ